MPSLPIKPATLVPRLLSEAELLARTARHFYDRGWMLGTSGSLSIHAESRRSESRAGIDMLVTVSGKDKGRLEARDLLFICDDGSIYETLGDPRASSEAFYEGQPRPSGETLVHRAIYEQISDAKAVYHVHSVFNTLYSQLADPGDAAELPAVEMLKGLGRWDGEPVGVPVVSNAPHIPDLAEMVGEAADPDVPGVLVQGHGIYVWGPGPMRTKRHVETFEFLFEYEIQRRSLNL